ncbi:SDR family oxidoreductase [Paenibacillus sp. N4]|uniref:NAD-dependent epimerase/dehydratase family protein n=1 Tax=Paenibacillus vietnamensis TaxID=2590547 RepID=UPI001CD0AFEA|nr:SDR family oxidoreductase [Paenibacillus vietnamensis]MCA0754954.1 SDR family oxidoreductase [Paenibacillus vietnamensis]
MTKTVMISGASGYFGTIACEFFASHGWKVLKASRHKKADIIFDLDEPESISKMRITEKVDLFIHAASANKESCIADPYNSISCNIVGTKAALDFCVGNQIEHFVYLSTINVFGQFEGYMNELSSPAPMDDYGISNLHAEEYVRMYMRQGKIKGMVIRPSSFIGMPKDMSTFSRWNLVPFSFCKQAFLTGEIVLETSGLQKRNFISILDICQVINLAFPRMIEFPLIHVLGPDTMTIRNVAELVQSIFYKSYQKKIRLVIPDATNHENEFIFHSLYMNDLYQPAGTVESHLECLSRKIAINHIQPFQ